MSDFCSSIYSGKLLADSSIYASDADSGVSVSGRLRISAGQS